jgi:hypothetical protein
MCFVVSIYITASSIITHATALFQPENDSGYYFYLHLLVEVCARGSAVTSQQSGKYVTTP